MRIMAKTRELPKIDWNSRVGIKGESLVRLRLADIALITKIEEDVGIDFLGVILKENRDNLFSPHMTFYIQAKGTEKFSFDFTAQIKVSTINHWLDREAPVFLFIVDVRNEDVYWISIEKMRSELVEKIKGRAGESKISFHVTEKEKLCKENIDNFIAEIELSKRLLIGRSIMDNFRWSPKGTGYIRKSPTPPRDLKELNDANIWLKDICIACSRYFYNSFVKGGRKKNEELMKAKDYAEFAWIVDKSHWEVPFTLALICSETKNKKKSMIFFDESIEMMKGDPGWISRKRGRLIYEQVLDIKKRINRGEKLFVQTTQ